MRLRRTLSSRAAEQHRAAAGTGPREVTITVNRPRGQVGLEQLQAEWAGEFRVMAGPEPGAIRIAVKDDKTGAWSETEVGISRVNDLVQLLEDARSTALRASEPREERYEPPTPDAPLVADLKAAIAGVPDVHEAYLVRRSTLSKEWEDVGVGVVAHVGGRWRSRRQIAVLHDALRPFYPPPFPSRLQWGSFGNSHVPDEVRAVGIPLG